MPTVRDVTSSPTQAAPAAGSAIQAIRTSLRPYFRLWKAYGERIAHYQSILLLTLVYFVVVGPTAILARLVGKRFLPSTFGTRGSDWIQRQPMRHDLDGMQRPY